MATAAAASEFTATTRCARVFWRIWNPTNTSDAITAIAAMTWSDKMPAPGTFSTPPQHLRQLSGNARHRLMSPFTHCGREPLGRRVEPPKMSCRFTS